MPGCGIGGCILAEQNKAGVRTATGPGRLYLILATVGLFLFDCGYHFARPMVTDLSSALDVVMVAGQVAATLAVALYAAFVTPRSKLSVQLFVSALVASVLAQVVILAVPADSGLFVAYTGTVLEGIAFGVLFVLWLERLSRVGDVRRAALGAVVALWLSRAADPLIRALVSNEGWLVSGFVFFDLSLALLAALVFSKRFSQADGLFNLPLKNSFAPSPSGEHAVVGIVGAGLFSALFGLMTQVHNESLGQSVIPDFASCLITLLLLLPLGWFVVRSQRPLRLGRLFLTTLPVIAGILALVALLQSDVLGMANALVKTLFNVYFVAVAVYLVQHRDKGVAFFALTLLAVWAGVLVGSAAGFAVSRFAGYNATTISAVALVAIWVCILASTFFARGAADAADKPQAVAPEPEQQVVYVDRHEDQVSRLSQRFGFSAREAQVVSLFAQGRSASRIAAELTLSENTVKTHLQNAYSKAGVHSKQELLDLLSQE